MQSISRRALGVIVLGLGPAMLMTGCGGGDTAARSTLAPIQPSSYVVREPVTTTTIPEGADATGTEVDAEGRSKVAQEYTVRSNDAVSAIASRFGISGDDLAAFNEWPDGIFQSIYPGNVIKIPPGALVPDAPAADPVGAASGDSQASEATATQTTLAGADGECVEGTYTLVNNDFPGRVATRFDITVEQLAEANANTPGYDRFVVGTEIKIPC